MPYKKLKQDCTQSDGDKGSYVLSYTDKKGKKHRACHTSKKKMQGQIAAIEGPREADESMEETLEETLRLLVKEVIVNYQGVEYDIPDEEAAVIKQRLEFGEADPTPENSRVFNAADERIATKVKEVFGGEVGDRVWDILSSFLPKSRNQAIKIILNNKKSFKDNVFSVAPSQGLTGQFPDDAWNKVLDLDQPQLGKGEIALALLLQGVTPDGGGGTHDLNIAGIGEVHVKNSPVGFNNPDVRMGKSLQVKDQTNWYKSLQAVGWNGDELSDKTVEANAKGILDSWAELTGKGDLIASADKSQYDTWADEWQLDFKDAFFKSESWGEAAALVLVNARNGGYVIVPPSEVWPARISQGSWKGGLKSKREFRFSNALKKGITASLSESRLREVVGYLVTESLSGGDKSDIKRMIKKELEGPDNRRNIDKHFKKHFDKELKKALGASFFGTPGKVNKFVVDEIHKEVSKSLGSTANKDVIIHVCKEVIKKLYRELSFSSPQIIDRINPKV